MSLFKPIMDKKKLALYDKIIKKCPEVEREGKVTPYATANGYMFTLINKSDELGIRFSEEVQKKYIKVLKTSTFKSYGSILTGYVLIPDSIWKDVEALTKYIREGYDFAMSLKPE
ncbi:MAG: hypothetical protein ACI8XB_000495 [Patiriisocius sp.]|jgi:hypothetical protein